MAMSASLQSVFLSPAMTGSAKRVGLNLCFPAPNYVPALRRSGSLSVRSSAENEQSEEPKPMSKTTPRVNPPPPPKPKAKVSTKFSDVLAFSGPAPERINGRLAMIGFAAAMAVEIANGEDLFAQISNGGIPWFVGTSIVLSLASLVPLFRGVSVESNESGGFMSPEAELWNGRFAMLGLVALAFTEYVKGGALV